MLCRYLVLTGAALNIILPVCLVVLYFWLDQPPREAIDRLANQLAYQRSGPEQKLGKFITGLGLARDWSALAGQIDKTRPLNFLANTANPELQFPYQHYDKNGRPIKSVAGIFSPPASSRLVVVTNSEQLVSALKKAQAGDIITLSSGHYHLTGRALPIVRPGTMSKPIYVRSPNLGNAVLEMDMLEGFRVKAPFWVFENLEIRGVCPRDDKCEHAFHVVSEGNSFTLRNSRIFDFNASVKVNGSGKAKTKSYPDSGLIEFNLFANQRQRNTDSPVALLNINSVNNWVVRGNFITDFSKNGGNYTSYGAYVKGGGRGSIIERNLVICEHQLAPDRGARIGLSFGGGGTGLKFCRTNGCSSEHSDGIMRNNIILNCSRDVGIYINKGNNSKIYHNLLHNTLGIDIRFASSSATVRNNLISGRLKARDGGVIHADNNLIDRDCLGADRSDCSFDNWYEALDQFDLRLDPRNEKIQGRAAQLDSVKDDFCGHPRGEPTDIGPIDYTGRLDCIRQ